MDKKIITTDDIANSLLTKKDLELFASKLIEAIEAKLQKSSSTHKEFLTPKEFAHLTGMKYSTVVYRCHTGALKARQESPKSTWLIHASELERYIKEADGNLA